jgi:hypothetical protein
MNLSQANQKYEDIIHSDLSNDRKNRRLADLMSEMEAAFKIPAAKNEAWEKENRAVIAMYRKISMSRIF